jgi:hypothetical protein
VKRAGRSCIPFSATPRLGAQAHNRPELRHKRELGGRTKQSRTFSSLNDVDQNDYDGNDQKNVNKTAHGVGSDEP